MGIKDLFSKWSKRDVEPVERSTPQSEDYEGHKADVRVGESFAGGEALDAARDDLDAP